MHQGLSWSEEYGPAEPSYDYWSGSRGRGRYHDEDVMEDADSEDFEAIEVSDARRYVDQWRDSSDCAMDFGELPLQDGEVLPAGALDGETPDEQRLTEATGNEGKVNFIDIRFQPGITKERIATLFASVKTMFPEGRALLAEVKTRTPLRPFSRAASWARSAHMTSSSPVAASSG